MHGFDTSSSTGERLPCHLRFADDIDLLGGSEEQLQQPTGRLEKTAVGCCWLWHGNQRRQKQNYRQQQQPKTIYQYIS